MLTLRHPLPLVFAFCVATVIASPAQTLTPLVKFTGTNGAVPTSSLIQGTDGNFYGTTSSGGVNTCNQPYGCGTVFKMNPAGELIWVYSFCSEPNCTDGSFPYGGLVQGSDGNFYGTTGGGGAGGNQNDCGATGCGTVFKMTPAGKLIWVYSFCSQMNCPDGAFPLAGLVQATDGNFYGTTQYGGAQTPGTIFQITADGDLTPGPRFFCDQNGYCPDGATPVAALVQGTDGNLYGTTVGGGSGTGCGGTGCGTVFTITPKGLFPLYSFCSEPNCTDGSFPFAGLVQAHDGNFYGTTQQNGAYNAGTVFKIFQQNGTWMLTPLYSFCSEQNCADGGIPLAGLVQATDGNFYGTTSAYGGAYSAGTVFKITPSGYATTLWSFCAESGCPDGATPVAGLTQGTSGNLYGTTDSGGEDNCFDGSSCGTVFTIPFNDYGVSGGNADDQCNGGGCKVGTLGAMVVRGPTQYVLSNDHVLGLPESPTHNDAPHGSAITRPGLFDNYCKPGNIVANLAFAPTLDQGSDSGKNVDAAIATVHRSKFSGKGEISEIGIPAGTIETLSEEIPVAKNGRSTGLTCGQVKAYDCEVNDLPYDDCRGHKFKVSFQHQIAIESDAGVFGCPGDSGSLIVDSATSQPVGLLFASTDQCGDQGGVTFANPIGTVLQRLDVGFRPNPTHAVEGCKGSLTSDTRAQLPELERQRVLRARENSRRILENRAVLADCPGAAQDDPTRGALVIYVRKGESADFIPRELDGVPTRIEYSEPFVADLAGSCPKTPSQPSTAGLNAPSGALFANSPIAPTRMMYGKIDAYANPVRGNDPSGLTNLIADISSYFAP